MWYVLHNWQECFRPTFFFHFSQSLTNMYTERALRAGYECEFGVLLMNCLQVCNVVLSKRINHNVIVPHAGQWYTGRDKSSTHMCCLHLKIMMSLFSVFFMGFKFLCLFLH